MAANAEEPQLQIRDEHFLKVILEYREKYDDEPDGGEESLHSLAVDIAEAAGSTTDESGVISQAHWDAVEKALADLTVWEYSMSVEDSMGDPDELTLLKFKNGNLALVHAMANESLTVPLINEEVTFDSVHMLLLELAESLYEEGYEGIVGYTLFHPSGIELAEGEEFLFEDAEFQNKIFDLEKLRALLPG